MARPAKEPHPLEKQIEAMAAINCTWDEISAVTGIPLRTAKRKFGTAYKKGRGQGKSSLRRHMWKKVEEGNVTMMIWLSKQLLGYADKVDQTVEQETKSEVIYKTQWAFDGDPNP